MNGECKEEVLERNRLAANKFRSRKRDETRELVSDERDLEDNYKRLSECHKELRDEVLRLKTLLLEHTHCDCELIRAYINRESQRIVKDAVHEETETPESPSETGSLI
jgi:hypothetical protein